ncbi:MAG: hypothetical protein ACRDNK_18150 [Solirubrobacteraceae bacterium]
MANRRSRASGAELALLAALAAWAAFPLVLLLVHAAQTHTIFTGADGLIGADGVLGADQLQYLAWARDAGLHGLASDLFTLTPSGHVYLEPLFTITGALGRAGLSLPVAYLLWKPVAVIALFLGAAAWARRLFEDQRAARTATVALSLFLCTPLAALFSWAQLGSRPLRFALYLLEDELLGASKLWGYVPSALGLALVPVALLAVERSIDPRGFGSPKTRMQSMTGGLGALVVAFLASAVASWLHPWQGITLIVIYVGLAVWQRLQGMLTLALAAIGAALPLAYYYLLSHGDPAWKLASHYEVIARLPALALLLGFGPLLLLAGLGLRRPGAEVTEQALLLWIAACFVTYFVNDSFAAHGLQGLSFPFAVLVVRGGQRLRLPVLVGALGVALLTIPGLAYGARKFVNTAQGRTVQYYLPHPDAQALAWVAQAAPAGGVLAPTPFATLVPSQTGRNVWVGHGYWSRDYPDRARQVDRLFRGRMRPALARSFVESTGATLLISDCAHHADLRQTLGPRIGSVHIFGCARVYVLARSARR